MSDQIFKLTEQVSKEWQKVFECLSELEPRGERLPYHTKGQRLKFWSDHMYKLIEGCDNEEYPEVSARDLFNFIHAARDTIDTSEMLLTLFGLAMVEQHA